MGSVWKGEGDAVEAGSSVLVVSTSGRRTGSVGTSSSMRNVSVDGGGMAPDDLVVV